MLNSERTALLEKIKQAEINAQQVHHIAIRLCIAVVNNDKELPIEDKERIIDGFYKASGVME